MISNRNTGTTTTGMESMFSAMLPARTYARDAGDSLGSRLRQFARTLELPDTRSRLLNAICYAFLTVTMASATGSLLVAYNYYGDTLGVLLVQWATVVVG